MSTPYRFANLDYGNFTGALNGEQVFPVTINGFRRIWSSSDGFAGNARLMLVPAESSSVVATTFGVSDPELLDGLKAIEEYSGGVQRAIRSEAVVQWRDTPLPEAFKEVLAYRYWSPAAASRVIRNQPIYWSQAAAILIACHRAGGLNFVDDFIRSTGGWGSTWLDDRQAPAGPWDLSDATRLELIVAREKLLALFQPKLRIAPGVTYQHLNGSGC
ncbi:MAG: hypothetical protein KIT79_10070 [Deltaproteobacteria bacterium]|nr:hypothetical protein [Deltaproteobacteria bacterium]